MGLNMLAWKSKTKYIIIESDDWGAIRMSSKEAYNDFLSNGYPVDQCHYNKYDSLESNSDVLFLAEVLQEFKDFDNHSPIITMNNIVANPDFNKIKEDGYFQYFFEPFDITLKNNPSSNRVMDIYKEGVEKEVFKFQLHGREHVNVRSWLKALQEGVSPFMRAFEHKMYSVNHENNRTCRSQKLDALNMYDPECKSDIESFLVEGQEIFRKVWGYNSTSFIAPCYTWHPNFESSMKSAGIKFIQGQRAQKVPSPTGLKRKYHYSGQISPSGLHYLIRNCTFEPSSDQSIDWVDSCMRDIDNAFRFRNAAIIESHRVNYVGTLDSRNRDNNLKQLKALFTQILKKWPNVRFISTSEYGEKMLANE